MRQLRKAQAKWRRMGARYQVCRIALDLAVAYEALSDRETARRERESSEVALKGLGAVEGLSPDLAGLTPRELHISESTVARHLANVYPKTGEHSRTAAVAWAWKRGLL